MTRAISPQKKPNVTAVRPAKKRGALNRLLGDMKRGLSTVRALLDLKHEWKSADGEGRRIAQARLCVLLDPYCQYLENPSPDNYHKARKLVGVFFLIPKPVAPASPVEELSLARAMRLLEASPLLLDGFPERHAEIVERAYARMYRDMRTYCVEARTQGDFPAVYPRVLALLGPRIRAEDPLSRDPLLLEEERLWLTNHADTPRVQRAEAHHFQQLIDKALTITGAGRPATKTRQQQLDTKAVKKALAQIRHAADRHRANGLPQPKDAWREAISSFLSRSRLSEERKQMVCRALRTRPDIHKLSLPFDPPTT